MYKHYLLLKAYDFDDIRFKLLEAEKNGKSYLLDYVKLATDNYIRG